MRFVIAGASGFLGTALRDRLARDGHEVTRLVRGEAVSQNESSWDPARATVDPSVIENAEVVMNLAGASFVRWPLTAAYKQAFRDSRVQTTEVLAEAIARSDRKPAFLAQNGTSFYGDRGDEVLTEESSEGTSGAFLEGITKEWQAATNPARSAGARVCVMRTSPVLDRSGGLFGPMHLLFKAGLGGPVGGGQQYFPTISLTDWVRAVGFLATSDSSDGVYNLTGPNPTTNAEFARELARMLHRPAKLRVPALPIRKVFPELSPEMLSSVRAEPARLVSEGFGFEHTTLNARLAAAMTG